MMRLTQNHMAIQSELTTIGFTSCRAFWKEGKEMKGSKLIRACSAAILGIGLTASSAIADVSILKNVVVNFGAGLNTKDTMLITE